MRKILRYFAVGLLLCVSILVPSLSSSVDAESSRVESTQEPELQSSWGEVDRLDIGTFDSNIIYLKENETQRMYGYVYFSGDQTAINQAKVSFKDVDPDLTIEYDNDLVVNGKTGSFSFTISLNTKDDKDHQFTVTVGDGVEDSNHLSPYSDTQTVIYDGTDTSDTTDSSTSETSSTSTTSATTGSNTSETSSTSTTSDTTDSSTSETSSTSATSDTSAHSNTSSTSVTSDTTTSTTSETNSTSASTSTSETSTTSTETDSTSEPSSTNVPDSSNDITSSESSDNSAASQSTNSEGISQGQGQATTVESNQRVSDKNHRFLKTGAQYNRLIMFSGVGLLFIAAVLYCREIKKRKQQ